MTTGPVAAQFILYDQIKHGTSELPFIVDLDRILKDNSNGSSTRN
jgi:hypothetical protein